MDVHVTEVGPRDGLQAIQSILPTHKKCEWIDALARAGLREIEVGSFVSARRVPQLADTAAVLSYARGIVGLDVVVLVPNLQGAHAAVEAGAKKLTIPISASEAHSLANVGKTPEQMVEELRRVKEYLHFKSSNYPDETFEVEVGISTSFGCSLAGRVSEDHVIALAVECARAGATSVGLSDTTGMASPTQVRRLFSRLKTELGALAGAAHLHNTRGLGLANALAAYETGVRSFDSSLGGLGGCPYAPGASGNIVTEDLVFMFEAMGVRTGVEFEALLRARELLRAAMPLEPLYGMTPEAGLPKDFVWPSRF